MIIWHRFQWDIKKIIMYVLEWQTVSALTGGLFRCLYPQLWSKEGNKTANNPQVSPETVHHGSTYIIIILTWQNESMNDHKRSLHIVLCLTRSGFVLLMKSQRLLMTSQRLDNCDVITWIMVSRLLDINFIQGDIHSLSCKRCAFIPWNTIAFTAWMSNYRGQVDRTITS